MKYITLLIIYVLCLLVSNSNAISIASQKDEFAALSSVDPKTEQANRDSQFNQLVLNTKAAIDAAIGYYESRAPVAPEKEVQFTMRMNVDISDVIGPAQYLRYIAKDISDTLNITSNRVTVSNLRADPTTVFPDAVYETAFLEMEDAEEMSVDEEEEPVDFDNTRDSEGAIVVEAPAIPGVNETVTVTEVPTNSTNPKVVEITEIIEELDVPFGRILVDVSIASEPKEVPVRTLFTKFKSFLTDLDSPIFKAETLLDIDYKYDLVPVYVNNTQPRGLFVFKNEIDPKTGLVKANVRKAKVPHIPEWLVKENGFSTPVYRREPQDLYIKTN